MQENRQEQLQYSELLAVWKHFGLSHEWQTRCLPAIIVKEHGDALTKTTEELIDVSTRREMDGDSYTPPPACKWCSGSPSECDEYWTYGHRHDWWVCTQCKRVFPCRHDDICDIDEFHLTGTCSTCGLSLPCSSIAVHLYKSYRVKAEHFLTDAERCLEQERLRREHGVLR